MRLEPPEHRSLIVSVNGRVPVADGVESASAVEAGDRGSDLDAQLGTARKVPYASSNTAQLGGRIVLGVGAHPALEVEMARARLQ
jgi:hypothetical protein